MIFKTAAHIDNYCFGFNNSKSLCWSNSKYNSNSWSWLFPWSQLWVRFKSRSWSRSRSRY